MSWPFFVNFWYGWLEDWLAELRLTLARDEALSANDQE